MSVYEKCKLYYEEIIKRRADLELKLRKYKEKSDLKEANFPDNMLDIFKKYDQEHLNKKINKVSLKIKDITNLEKKIETKLTSLVHLTKCYSEILSTSIDINIESHTASQGLNNLIHLEANAIQNLIENFFGKDQAPTVLAENFSSFSGKVSVPVSNSLEVELNSLPTVNSETENFENFYNAWSCLQTMGQKGHISKREPIRLIHQLVGTDNHEVIRHMNTLAIEANIYIKTLSEIKKKSLIKELFTIRPLSFLVNFLLKLELSTEQGKSEHVLQWFINNDEHKLFFSYLGHLASYFFGSNSQMVTIGKKLASISLEKTIDNKNEIINLLQLVMLVKNKKKVDPKYLKQKHTIDELFIGKPIELDFLSDDGDSLVNSNMNEGNIPESAINKDEHSPYENSMNDTVSKRQISYSNSIMIEDSETDEDDNFFEKNNALINLEEESLPENDEQRPSSLLIPEENTVQVSQSAPKEKSKFSEFFAVCEKIDFKKKGDILKVLRDIFNVKKLTPAKKQEIVKQFSEDFLEFVKECKSNQNGNSGFPKKIINFLFKSYILNDFFIKELIPKLGYYEYNKDQCLLEYLFKEEINGKVAIFEHYLNTLYESDHVKNIRNKTTSFSKKNHKVTCLKLSTTACIFDVVIQSEPPMRISLVDLYKTYVKEENAKKNNASEAFNLLELIKIYKNKHPSEQVTARLVCASNNPNAFYGKSNRSDELQKQTKRPMPSIFDI